MCVGILSKVLTDRVGPPVSFFPMSNAKLTSYCLQFLYIPTLQAHAWQDFLLFIFFPFLSKKVNKHEKALKQFFLQRSFAMPLQDGALWEWVSLFLIIELLTDVLSSPNNQPKKWGPMFSLRSLVGKEKHSGRELGRWEEEGAEGGVSRRFGFAETCKAPTS